MNAIEPGTIVSALTATGDPVTRRAVSGVVDGLDFPVVWITPEDEWTASQRDGRPANALPWPAEDVIAIDGETEAAA